jgi:uncharacterized protein (TIGR02145 family)
MKSKWIVPVVCAGLLLVCTKTPVETSGTVSETDTATAIYNPDNTPAVGATVRFFASMDSTRTIALQSITDVKGHYSVTGLAKGSYNMLATKDSLIVFQDSIFVLSDTVLIKPDTLMKQGSVIGTIGLQPNHDPRTVTVLVLGTDLYSNVDMDGKFTLSPIAKGDYHLRLVTTQADYTPTYVTIHTQGQKKDTLADTLWMTYTGIPVVTGLAASYDTLNGKVRLSWKKAKYRDFQRFLIFKENYGSIVLSSDPISASSDTFFIDTVFKRKLNSGEFSFEDTSDYHYQYRVCIQNNSTKRGDTYKYIDIVAASPKKVEMSFAFTTFHVGKRFYSDSASINDSILYSVKVSDPYRQLRSLEWIDLETGKTARTVSLDSTKNTASDSCIYSWDSVGEKGMICKVTDMAGTVWKDTVKILVVKDAPIVGMTASPETVGINDTIRIHVNSKDKYGKIVKVEWDVGNTGKFVVGARVDTVIDTIVFAPEMAVKGYLCMVRVTDDDGSAVMDTVSVNVETRAPTANAGPNTAVGINDTIKLHGIGTDETAIVRYEWKIGTGAWVATSRGDRNLIAPATAQAYVCSLKVMDDDGNSAKSAMTVTVEMRPPTAIAGPDTVVFVNGQIRLHGSSSFDETKIVQFAWKCGNDNWSIVPSGDTIISAPSTEQALVCSLKVVDDDGNMSFAQKTVFTTFQPIDFDGNKYDVVRIGSQFWTVQNLRATKYNDGTAIPLVTDNKEWYLSTGAYCFYNNSTDSAFQQIWGALYNWYAVNTGKLAPAGWHVPTDAEWSTLATFCGGGDVAGNKLKAKTGWASGGNGTDGYSFSALPGGYRHNLGNFNSQSSNGYWWSATEDAASHAVNRHLYYNYSYLYRSGDDKSNGFSVRLVRD